MEVVSVFGGGEMLMVIVVQRITGVTKAVT